MAHILDIMSTIGRQLTALNDYYNNGDGKGLIRTIPNCPEFIYVVVDRAVGSDRKLLEDPSSAITIEKTIKINLDKTNSDCVYLCVTTNTTGPIVDKVPVFADKNGSSGYGTGYIICVPKSMFVGDDEKVSIKMLRTLYFDLLKMDPLMEYAAGPGVIRFSNSKEVKISSYDLTLCVVAIVFMYHNARRWFNIPVGNGNFSSIKPSYVLDTFTEKELTAENRQALSRVMEVYNTNYDDIKNGIASGKLLKLFMYPKKK